MDPITNATPSNNIGAAADNPQVIGLPQVDPSLVIPTAPVAPEASEGFNIGAEPDAAPASEPTVDLPTSPMAIDSPTSPMASPVMNPATMATPDLNIPPMPDNTVAAPTPAVNFGGIGATDPITMPTPPKAPDPVEEELKAPLRAAGPVPGSIGSAISMPAEGENTGGPTPDLSMFNVATTKQKRTPNVAFNDPAKANAGVNQPMAMNKTAKKSTSKTTYILLGVVGVMVVIALVAVLISQINS